MSATINCNLFSKYFATEKFNIIKDGKRIKERVPILDVENIMFEVNEFYWDDLVSSNSFLSNTIQKSFKENLMKNNRANHQYYDQSTIYQRKYRESKSQETFHSFNQYHQYLKTDVFYCDKPEMNEDTRMMCINLLK